MKNLYMACRALYESAFPGSSKAWDDALFRHVMPQYLRVIREGEKPLSMLFSIPYPIQTEKGCLEARYLYAVATDPAYQGRGLAKQLLGEVASEGYPVFLRPSSEGLFSFYQRAGFSPMSPMLTEVGTATPGDVTAFRHLSVEEYLRARTAFLPLPHAEPTPAFLSLGFSLGGAVALENEFVAFYERRGALVWFKEWLGKREFAPRAAAFLGAAQYKLRTPDKGGAPFGVGIGVPRELAFSIALD